MSRKNKTKSSLLAACCMPVLICLLCGGIALLALIRPYEKMSTYLHIAFMDSMKTGTGRKRRIDDLKKNIKARHYHVTFEPLFDDIGEIAANDG